MSYYFWGNDDEYWICKIYGQTYKLVIEQTDFCSLESTGRIKDLRPPDQIWSEEQFKEWMLEHL